MIAAIAVAAAVAACSSDPLSKSPDVVARTVGQDLTVDQMTKLLADAKVRIAFTPENGVIVANLWSSYQRLAYAAAHNDTLSSQIAASLAPATNALRVNHYLESIRPKPAPGDTATEEAYRAAKFGLYSVRHIFFPYPANPGARQHDSVIAVANSVRPSVTAANFAAMAKRYSADARTSGDGGYLGVFPKSALNPNAGAIVAALPPGGISAPVASPAGVDIIGRLTWADAKPQYAVAYNQALARGSDSTASEAAAKASGISVTSKGPDAAREAAANPVKGSHDETVIATYDRGGKLTAAELLSWVNMMPPPQRVQVLRELPQQADAQAELFIRNMAIRSVLLRTADSAGIKVPDSLGVAFRAQFLGDIVRTWAALGVSPERLADSAKTVEEREQLAARRASEVVRRGMLGEVQLPPVSVSVEAALDRVNEVLLSSDALSRSVRAAVALRKSIDSAAPPAQKTAPEPKKR